MLPPGRSRVRRPSNRSPERMTSHIAPTQVSTWKKDLEDHMPSIFERKNAADESAKKQERPTSHLERNNGQLVIDACGSIRPFQNFGHSRPIGSSFTITAGSIKCMVTTHTLVNPPSADQLSRLTPAAALRVRLHSESSSTLQPLHSTSPATKSNQTNQTDQFLDGLLKVSTNQKKSWQRKEDHFTGLSGAQTAPSFHHAFVTKNH